MSRVLLQQQSIMGEVMFPGAWVRAEIQDPRGQLCIDLSAFVLNHQCKNKHKRKVSSEQS